jgi:hypothetical protein
MVVDRGVPLVTKAVRGSREMCDVVPEMNRFSNLLGYQQRLADRWCLRGEGKPISNTLHYDPEAQAKLDVASDASDDVDFDTVARVVAVEDAPIGDLSAALDETLRSPVRDQAGDVADTDKE